MPRKGVSSKDVTGAVGFGAAAMLVCCGSHLIVIGALGGLAIGSVLGLATGVVVLVAVGVAAQQVRRRRRAACAVPAPTTTPTRSAATTPPLDADLPPRSSSQAQAEESRRVR